MEAPAVPDLDWEKLAEELDLKSPLEIMDQALATFGNDIAIAFSGAEDVALIEYAHLTGRPFRVFRCGAGAGRGGVGQSERGRGRGGRCFTSRSGSSFYSACPGAGRGRVGYLGFRQRTKTQDSSFCICWMGGCAR